MAYGNILINNGAYLAGADLTSKIKTFVISDGDEVTSVGSGEAATGVLWNDPNTGEAAVVIRQGEPDVYAGAAIAIGAEIAADAQGRAVTAVSGDVILGEARTATTGAGQLVRITLYPTAQSVKA